MKIGFVQYPIVSIEDGRAEDDKEGWKGADSCPRKESAAGRDEPIRHEQRNPRRGH